MKKLLYSLIVAGAMTLASCSLTHPVSATSNPLGSKEGKASGTCFLGVLCFDVDASVQTAAKNGGITKISTVDLQTKNILGIIVTYTCIVTGE
jgi:hypothetical protein